jgi:hypothetical protein
LCTIGHEEVKRDGGGERHMPTIVQPNMSRANQRSSAVTEEQMKVLLSGIIPSAGSGLGNAIGFALKSYSRFFDWNFLCRHSTIAKIRLCEHS